MNPIIRAPLPSAVVCNTGPIIAMNGIGQLNILNQLISGINITAVVAGELSEGLLPQDQALRKWLDSTLIRNPTMPPDAFLAAELDAGEASVIALAKELNIAVLMDERKGRRVAAMVYGLPVIGTGRLLIEAKERGMISSVRPLLEQMRSGGYYVSDRLFLGLCREAGE